MEVGKDLIERWRSHLRFQLPMAKRCSGCSHFRQNKEGVLGPGKCSLLHAQIETPSRYMCPGWQSNAGLMRSLHQMPQTSYNDGLRHGVMSCMTAIDSSDMAGKHKSRAKRILKRLLNA